jgi:hypothetical protein
MKTAPCKEAIDLRRDKSSVEGHFSLETAAIAIEIAGAHFDRFFQMHLEIKLILIPPFGGSISVHLPRPPKRSAGSRRSCQ